MDNLYFSTSFSEGNIPEYRCPFCLNASLVKEDLSIHSTASSNRNRHEDWWEYEHEETVFRLILRCPRCDELVFAHGDGFIDEEFDVDSEEQWSRYYVQYIRPKNFFPPLKFIICPPATPKEVQAHLETASSLFHAYPSASCNSLRMAAEDILTSLGVPEAKPGGFLSFGNRIKKLPDSSNEYNLLDAIRWLGNEGSHSGSKISHEDAGHAFEVIDLLLEECYGDRKKKIHDLAAAIRKHKGPVGGQFLHP